MLNGPVFIRKPKHVDSFSQLLQQPILETKASYQGITLYQSSYNVNLQIGK